MKDLFNVIIEKIISIVNLEKKPLEKADEMFVFIEKTVNESNELKKPINYQYELIEGFCNIYFSTSNSKVYNTKRKKQKTVNEFEDLFEEPPGVEPQAMQEIPNINMDLNDINHLAAMHNQQLQQAIVEGNAQVAQVFNQGEIPEF
jgi:hypothetical protein